MNHAVQGRSNHAALAHGTVKAADRVHSEREVAGGSNHSTGAVFGLAQMPQTSRLLALALGATLGKLVA